MVMKTLAEATVEAGKSKQVYYTRNFSWGASLPLIITGTAVVVAVVLVVVVIAVV